MLREVALAAEALAGCEGPVADLARDAVADLRRRRAERRAGLALRLAAQIASIADGASGRVWPPSTTIVWPVMNFASSVARKSAA